MKELIFHLNTQKYIILIVVKTISVVYNVDVPNSERNLKNKIKASFFYFYNINDKNKLAN